MASSKSRISNLGMIARKRLGVAAVLALATGLLSAHGVFADVLKVAPKDSLAIIQIKNLESTSKKVADLSAKLGIAAMNPEMADPLGALLAKGKIKDGLNKAGTIGVILLPASSWPADTAGDEKEPAALLLLPVSDYKSFIGNFEGATTDADVTSITWEGKPSFVANWGEYAAISPKKEFLALKGDGLTVNAAAAKEFAGKDMVLWANLPALNAALGPKLTADKGKWLAKVDEDLKANPEAAKFAGVAKAALSQLVLAGETFLSNAQGATISLNLTDAGLNYSVAAEFAPDSYLGKFVASLKGDTGSFTQGLPAGSYLMYGGFAGNGEVLAGLVKDFSAPIVKELTTVEGGNAAEVQTTLDAVDKMIRNVKSTSFGMLAPRGALGAESIFQVVAISKGDAKAYVDAFKSYSESYTKLITALGGGQLPMTTEYKPAAKTLDGVTFDAFAVTANANPKTPEEAQMAQMMTMMYGPNGMSSDVGQLDANTVVIGTGLSDASLSKLIASAKAGGDEVGSLAHVQATVKELPSKPVGAGFVALDEIVKTAISYARQFGMPANIALPDNLPPIGFAVDTEGSTLRLDTHVPTELVQSLVAAYLQMQGGGGGGGGL